VAAHAANGGLGGYAQAKEHDQFDRME